MTAKLAVLEERLEFDDIVRYRQLGRAVHEQRVKERVKERGGGGGSEQKREGDKGGGGFFGWFQKRDEAATRAAEAAHGEVVEIDEQAPQPLRSPPPPISAASRLISSAPPLWQALQRLGDALQLGDAQALAPQGHSPLPVLPALAR